MRRVATQLTPRPIGTPVRHNASVDKEPVHRQVVVLAGPSGSGKSRLCRRLGLPFVNLDDFYKDGDDATIPRVVLPGGEEIADWDDPGSWLRDEAARRPRAALS